jgi:thymidylate synthase (FAD)
VKITLLHNSPLDIADLAIGKCWDKESKDEAHKLERIHRIGNKYKHASTLEHISYTFDIDGISRACLQELARHRHQSLSVKSTRYTLKELKTTNRHDTADFLVQTGNAYVDLAMLDQLDAVWVGVQDSISNDVLKYLLPEAYKTSLVSTMNMRALQNFLQLRTSKAALWEIRELANAMFKALPEDHKFMLREFVQDVT